MPLPLLIGVAILAGGYGVKKGIDAKSDFSDAKDLNQEAQEIFNESKGELEKTRELTQSAMEDLGRLKFELYKNSIIPFVDSFSKIKNINFNDADLSAQGLPKISVDELNGIQQSALEMIEVVSGGVTAIGSGGLAGLAAYGGVGLLGTASTGASIAGLSGAAATNATLAWLGGGSLATGGMGMAGGAAVLGGIVAGPVLAIGGMMLASKAEAAKEDAYSNIEKANIAVEEMNMAMSATLGIQKRFEEIGAVLYELNVKFTPLLLGFKNLVLRETNYQLYSECDKKGVFLVASLAKTIKNILEIPLLDETGSPTQESDDAVILIRGDSTTYEHIFGSPITPTPTTREIPSESIQNTSFSLSKGGNISLEKLSPGISNVTVGLGWDCSGALEANIDLDGSVFLLDNNGKVRSDEDFIFYNQLASTCGSVVHLGDNQTGEEEEDGDNESIKILLSSISMEIEKISIAVSIHDFKNRGQSFSQVKNSFVRVTDNDTEKEICRYELSSELSGETSMIFGEIYRHKEEWKFRAVGQGFIGGISSLTQKYGVETG